MTGERSVDVAAGSGTLHIALLGGFSVRVGSCAVPGSWRLRKSKTLVKLLALADGHRAHRDVLAGVLRASYPAETYARLSAVKAHYDPVNRFRFNQNIRPAQAG
jgi:hypothetical protein